MAHFDVTVVPARLFTDTDDQKRWDFNGDDESFEIPSDFISSDQARWFRRLIFRIDNSEIRFILGRTSTWPTGQQGDDLISDWEDAAVAMIATQGSDSVEIPGPNFSGNIVQDSGETYIWRPQPGDIFTFFTNLDTAADWTLSLRDPAESVENSDAAIEFFAGTPSFSVSPDSQVVQNSDAAIEFAAGTPSFVVSPDSEAIQNSDAAIEFSAGTPSFVVSPDAEDLTIPNSDAEIEFSAGTPSFVVSPDTQVVASFDLGAHLTAGRSGVQAGLNKLAAAVLGAPTDLQVSEPGRTTTLLSWMPPDDGGDPITRYDVRIGTGAWVDTLTSAAQYLLTRLTPGTTYTVQVRAVNAIGTGTESAALSFSTVEAGAPSIPRFFRAEPAGDTAVDLFWTIPENIYGSELLHYEICVMDPDGFVYPWEQTDSVVDTFRVRGLARGHRYSFRVQAVSTGGTGPPTPFLSAVPIDVPAVVVPTGQALPLLDVDRQSLIVRLADMDCRVIVFWQPQDLAWYASLEVPVNTSAVTGRRLALDSGLLDRVSDVLPGNLSLRELGTTGAEPQRDAWARPTHALRWEPA